MPVFPSIPREIRVSVLHKKRSLLLSNWMSLNKEDAYRRSRVKFVLCSRVRFAGTDGRPSVLFLQGGYNEKANAPDVAEGTDVQCYCTAYCPDLPVSSFEDFCSEKTVRSFAADLYCHGRA
jgi:hypothetical protein